MDSCGPEDIADFSGRIYKEASRLISLVEDIIELSRLDEGENELTLERINLTNLCKGVVSRLEDKAKKNKVSVEVSGESSEIIASSHLLKKWSITCATMQSNTIVREDMWMFQ